MSTNDEKEWLRAVLEGRVKPGDEAWERMWREPEFARVRGVLREVGMMECGDVVFDRDKMWRAIEAYRGEGRNVRKRVTAWRWAAAAVLVLLAGGAAWMLSEREPARRPVAQAVEIEAGGPRAVLIMAEGERIDLTQPVDTVLERDGVEVQRHPWLEGCLLLTGTGDMERLSAYQKGYFYIQDAAARLAVTAASVRPGQRVLDCCAAPGGKSFAAGVDMENQGEILSCDIHPHKIKLLEAGASRLGLSILTAQLQSAAQRREDWAERFDTVLVDVPCSGLGIIRKKPDIRYKDPKPLDGLPQVQKGIVDNCAAYVRPGGVMIYATCTLRERENQDVVAWFLEQHPEFTLEAFELPHFGRQEGMMTFWPHIHHTDGFFVARLRKKEV